MRRRFALLLIAAIVIGGVSLSGRVVGRRADLDPVLKVLETSLHDRGIDVVGGKTEAYDLGSRPRLAPLIGMPTARPSAGWGKRPWMEDFRKGVAGFVAGAKSDRG